MRSTPSSGPRSAPTADRAMPSPLPNTNPSDFRPLPLLHNPHVQTLLGHLWPCPKWSHPVRRHVVRVADGDAVVLYDTAPPGWAPGGPVAVLVHGLTGSHRSAQVQRL